MDSAVPITALHRASALALVRIYYPDSVSRLERLKDEAPHECLTGLVRLLKPRARDKAKEVTGHNA